MKSWVLPVLIGLVGWSTLTQVSFGDTSKREGYYLYWLEAAGPSSRETDEYTPLLVLSRLPLSTLAKLEAVNAHARKDVDPPLLDASAIYLETYRRQAIWNRDARPIKILRDIKRVDEASGTATIGGRNYTIRSADIEDVIQLLEHPEGTPPVALHRRHGPLEGARHTARALAMLLKEQSQASEDR